MKYISDVIHCIRCSKIINSTNLQKAELCGVCYYSKHSETLDSYMPELEMMEHFRNLYLENKKHNPLNKKCNQCDVLYPNTSEYFYRLGVKDYLRSNCKKCHNMKKS